MAVLRVVSAIVAVAMLSISGTAALRHVHAYADHDHVDHRHGAASHTHATPAHDAPDHASHPDPSASDHGLRLEGCEPESHAVSVVLTYVASRPDHSLAPVVLETVIVRAPEETWFHVTPSDVCAHSPPRLTDAPLRAPPLVQPA
jgi:hypothetical protein